jgi:hypothetical protein
LTRSRQSAKAAGTRFERTIADYLAGTLDDDRVDRRVCAHCDRALPPPTTGRGGRQSNRKFCSQTCKSRARNESRKSPTAITCTACGNERHLLHPAFAGKLCRPCAAKLASAAAVARLSAVPISTRIAANVETSADGCWNWTGYCYANGYSALSVDGHQRLAHRLSYEAHIGPIPLGLVIDHLCENKRCVNPQHLEPVSSAENTRRSLRNRRTREES